MQHDEQMELDPEQELEAQQQSNYEDETEEEFNRNNARLDIPTLNERLSC